MFETALYFVRYLTPIALSSLTVFALAFLNHMLGLFIWRGRAAEPIEILSYSILFVGPVAFSVSFVFYFYGIELLKEQWIYAKIVFISAAILVFIGLFLDVAFIPKIK